jgi:hypothetical protein
MDTPLLCMTITKYTQLNMLILLKHISNVNITKQLYITYQLALNPKSTETNR